MVSSEVTGWTGSRGTRHSVWRDPMLGLLRLAGACNELGAVNRPVGELRLTDDLKRFSGTATQCGHSRTPDGWLRFVVPPPYGTWVPDAPTWPWKEPMGPKHACFHSSERRRSRQLSAALPAIAHENPLGLAKLLKTNDRKLAERVGFELDQGLSSLQVTETTLPPLPGMPSMPSRIARHCPPTRPSIKSTAPSEILNAGSARFLTER